MATGGHRLPRLLGNLTIPSNLGNLFGNRRYGTVVVVCAYLASPLGFGWSNL